MEELLIALEKCHNINITMGEYVLNSTMISIPMGGADVLLGVQSLQSLGTMDFNFKKRSWNFHGKVKNMS